MQTSRFGAMRLGCRGALAAPINRLRAIPVNAYSRIVGTPRVSGRNDLYRDCVPVAACNAVQTALSRAGDLTPIADGAPLELYKSFGFDPLNPATDRGMNPEILLQWWTENPIQGCRLKRFMRIEHRDENAIRQMIMRMGGVLLVVDLAEDQKFQAVWQASPPPDGTPGSWGAHALWVDEFAGRITCGTSWGALAQLDHSYFSAGYVRAAYVLSLSARIPIF